MAKFVWEAKNKAGSTQKGVMEASTQELVESKLKSAGFTGISVKAETAMSKEIKLFGRGVSGKEIVIFTRQFATMIDSGLPLVQCLEILSSQQENKSFKAVLLKVKESVESGSTFADALAKHPKVFDSMYVSLVAAGEVGGILDTILSRLAAYTEKSMKLKRQIKGAMVYPSMVVLAALAVLTVILLWVIPEFAKIFKESGAELPAPTKVVIWISDSAVKYSIFIFIALVIIGVLVKLYYDSDNGKRVFHRFFLNFPVIGPLVRKVAVAKFTRTLGTLVSSGVPILDGLDIVAKTAGNKVVEEAIMKVRSAISEGKTIAEPLAESGVFPPMVVQMIAVGEATGAMDAMLSKIADFYDDEVDTAVAALTSMLEPLLMIFLGVVVGGLVICMYLPIFKIAGVAAQ